MPVGVRLLPSPMASHCEGLRMVVFGTGFAQAGLMFPRPPRWLGTMLFSQSYPVCFTVICSYRVWCFCISLYNVKCQRNLCPMQHHSGWTQVCFMPPAYWQYRIVSAVFMLVLPRQIGFGRCRWVGQDTDHEVGLFDVFDLHRHLKLQFQNCLESFR